MDFLGIGVGLPQLLVVLVVAFFVLGPERMPEVARQLARGVRTLRSYATDVQTQFEGEFGDLREEFMGVQRDLTSIQQELRGGLLEIDSSVRAAQNDFRSAATEAFQGTTADAALAEPASLDYRPDPIQPVAPPVQKDEPPDFPQDDDGRLPDYRPHA
jgi:Tat protein translocase TatB subunit